MIYVICANDSLEEATTDKKKAERRLKELQKELYQRAVEVHGRDSSWDDYIARVYWHLHEVKEVI